MVYFKYLIEETFTCKVELADNKDIFANKASDIVGYDWMLFSSNEELTKEQSLNIEKASMVIPGMYVRSLQGDSLKISAPSLHLASLPEAQKLLKTIAQVKGIDYTPDEAISGFIPVSMDYLAKVFHARCDFFIKLSDVKFLKIMKVGTEIQGADLKRYSKNDVNQLYVRSEDFDSFLDSVEYTEKDFSTMSAEESNKELASDMTFAHDTFYQLSRKFGMNTKALTYANQAVESLYSLIESEENLKLVWQALMKKKNFMTEHSLMVGYLANAVLSHTEYKNENNSIRLTLAALLHDVELRNEKFYQLEIEDNDDNFSLKEVAAYQSHVYAGAEFLTKFKCIPSDLDKILLTHHEKYDGSGFPRGLSGPKLPLLSAIFIVCHEFVIHMMNHKFSETEIEAFIKEKKAIYTVGSFKEVIQTLEKIR